MEELRRALIASLDSLEPSRVVIDAQGANAHTISMYLRSGLPLGRPDLRQYAVEIRVLLGADVRVGEALIWDCLTLIYDSTLKVKAKLAVLYLETVLNSFEVPVDWSCRGDVLRLCEALYGEAS